MKQWEIAGEMRKRIMRRFVEEGIEIPFPHRTVYWGVDQTKLPWDKSANGAGPDGEGRADEFMPPGSITPSQREAALAEMAIAARAATELMEESRLLDEAARPSGAQPGNQD
jgi:small conductance mechanosensitive channel